MPAPFTSLRTDLYCLFFLWAVLTLSLAAALVAKLNSGSNTYYNASVELLVTAVLSLFVIPLHFLFHRRPTTSVVGTVGGELVVLGALSFLYLGGAAAISDHLYDGCDYYGGFYFNPLSYPSPYYTGFNYRGTARALEAFAWLAWLTLVVLIGFVVATGVLEVRRGRNTYWREQYAWTGRNGVTPPPPTPMGNAPMAQAYGV